MRSMAEPDYRYEPISEKRKIRLSEIHRKRWGAPDGYCTVRGVHVPFEHRAPVRYWADWIAYHQGKDAAAAWVHQLKNGEWSEMPKIQELYQQRLEVRKTREFIRKIQWEIAHAN